jgi:hypothetical protein
MAKKNFLNKILDKLDSKMKEAANKESEKGCCCSDGQDGCKTKEKDCCE